ncbi:hypothetical protein PV328_001167 [Microctonus aethiopoides]|uniref:PML C-terminal domain-containing protein n=1 Tax=Microctonus aethiopoides TaxID=144406 RepID=A0AA39FWR4_9HYME|nr:hypothetical protein PV328_001167 [Microctonus aethiopoides]
MSKQLYAIKKIPKAAIEYLLYCFNNALRANEGSVEFTKAAILKIVPHAFGEHDSCGSWCNYASNPEAFRHKYLPGGKPLTGDELKTSILPIFKQAADNAEKLAPRGSSQINENCNAVITSKAPKAKYYSDSSSSDFRVAAGITQVNLGRNYINNVISTLHLSPLKNKSLLYRIRRDEKRKKINSLIKTVEFKKKRRILFRNRQKLNASAEAREGITYQSNSEIDIVKRAITGFIAFLESISSSVMLAAHNGLKFDAPRILTLIKHVDLLREFQSIADKKNDGSKQQCGVSVNIITKIAKAGISMCLLQKTYRNNGFEGLKILLSQSINQKPRVTARIMTMMAIQKKLHELIIACFLHNEFGARLDSNVDFSEKVEDAMNSKKHLDNTLASEVETNRWARRNVLFNTITSDNLTEFPELTERELKIFFTGSYQMSQAVSYLAEVVNDDGIITLQYVKITPSIIKTQPLYTIFLMLDCKVETSSFMLGY